MVQNRIERRKNSTRNLNATWTLRTLRRECMSLIFIDAIITTYKHLLH